MKGERRVEGIVETDKTKNTNTMRGVVFLCFQENPR
jgi:hypothetical protein